MMSKRLSEHSSDYHRDLYQGCYQSSLFFLDNLALRAQARNSNPINKKIYIYIYILYLFEGELKFPEIIIKHGNCSKQRATYIFYF